MSTSSTDGVFGLGTSVFIVPPGATNALYITEVSGQNCILLKYRSGGTLFIMGVGATGATLSGTQLANGASFHYLMGTSEALSIDGPCRFYLAALSATTIVDQMTGKSQGT